MTFRASVSVGRAILPSVAFVSLLTYAGGAAAQAPVRKLLDKVPSLFGEQKQPEVSIPETPVIPGVTRAAPTTIVGDASTFDLGGFRPGMSEAEMEQVLRSRRYATTRVSRVVDFETQVRGAISTRGGAGGRTTRKSVLGEATVKDDVGGTYLLRTTVWPDGAHLFSIGYLPAPGTSTAEWRRLLVAKWGRPSAEEMRETFDAQWKGGPSGGRASAQVGLRGGSVYVEPAEGTRLKPGALIDAAVDAFFAGNARRPSL